MQDKAGQNASVADFWERLGSTSFSVRQILDPDDWVQKLESSRPVAPPLPENVKRAPGRIAVLDSPTEEDVRAFIIAGQPVLMKNWARDAGWSGVLDRWGLDFFKQEHLAKLEVGLDLGNGSRRRTTLGEYANELQQSPSTKAYLRLWHYEEECPELSDFFTVPACFQDGFEKLPAKFRPSKLPRWVFIGPEAAYTPLHTDPYATHAWFLQVRGAKRFEIFDPAFIAHLSDGSEFADLREHSAKFPKANDVPKLIADVGEGDLLFLPANWPHTVETVVGPSISLTHNFLDEFGLQVVRTAFLLFKSRNVWKSIDADVVAKSPEKLQSNAPRQTNQKMNAWSHNVQKFIISHQCKASMMFALVGAAVVFIRSRDLRK